MIDNRQQEELTFWVNNLIEFPMMGFFSVGEVWRAHKSPYRPESSHKFQSKRHHMCVACCVFGFWRKKNTNCMSSGHLQTKSRGVAACTAEMEEENNEHKCYDSIQWDLNAAINHVQLVMAALTLELRLAARWYLSGYLVTINGLAFGIWFSVFFYCFSLIFTVLEFVIGYLWCRISFHNVVFGILYLLSY